MIISRTLSVLLATFFLLFARPAAAAAYLSAVNDLPLMTGLNEALGQGVVFDVPQGRIVQAYASGPVSRAAVESFYAATLPQLGWRPAGPMRFNREGEQLALEITETGATSVTVLFILKPAPKSP
ncbi:MAG TPA: hypothetical protein ENI55_06500 [Alphaproteobacteria bacterium]|nr:hypothetical protein [Alphaproteobacteria bacterium]